MNAVQLALVADGHQLTLTGESLPVRSESSSPVDGYPDLEAKLFEPGRAAQGRLEGHQLAFDLPCPAGIVLGQCEGDQDGEVHQYAKALYCGREWCKTCGESRTMRRLARWLSKAQQCRVLAMVVVSIPPERHELPGRDLSAQGVAIRKAMVDCGFPEGMSRWHFFGECPVHRGEAWYKDTPCRCNRHYHPHLNLLMPWGFIGAGRLRRMRQAVARALVVDVGRVDIHAQYTRAPAKMVHMLKYVNRPTFLEHQWDTEAATEMLRTAFRVSQTWGRWKGPKVWELRPKGKLSQLRAISEGQCLVCGTKVHWDGYHAMGLVLADELWAELEGGYWIRAGPVLANRKRLTNEGTTSIVRST